MIGGRRLGGADRFLLLLDREMRRLGLHGFQAVLAVELEGEMEESRRARLAASFRALLSSEPRGRARLARRFGFGPLALAPRSARDEPAAFRERTGASPDLLVFARERWNEPLDPERDALIDLELERTRGATRLALRWWHPILDERGAELLLRELSRRETGGGEPPAATAPDPAAGMSFLRRRAAFKAARLRLEQLTQGAPFRLPAPAEAGALRDASWRVEADRLEPDETSRFLAAADAGFGARGEGLAQAALLFGALADAAGDGKESLELALPVSVQLRPPRARGPIGANALSFFWYALPVATARDRDLGAARLRELARAKVAAGEEVDAAALLELGRWLPLPLYRKELPRADGSARFSAAISTLGELLAAGAAIGGARAGGAELFGMPIRDALALTAFPAPPGLGVVFSRAGGALRISTCHAPALVDPGAARRLHERLVARARELAAAR
jgi:hypothetical protein